MSDLPIAIAAPAQRLQEAIELREAASTTTDFVRLRAREEHLVEALVDALAEAAVAHRAGDFEGLHPRDRLGRFMEKLGTKLHQRVVGFARAQAAKSKNARIRRDVEDLTWGSLLHEARRIEEATAGHNFNALHPRDRLGKFMEKVSATIDKERASAVKKGRSQYVFMDTSGKVHKARLPNILIAQSHARNRKSVILGRHGNYKRQSAPSGWFAPEGRPEHLARDLVALSAQEDQGNPGTPRGDNTVRNNLEPMDRAWEKAREQRAQVDVGEVKGSAAARATMATGKPAKIGRVGKARALVASGLARDMADARAQLADMGE